MFVAPPSKFVTRTRLQRQLRRGAGCMQAKKHAQAMLEAGRPMRCWMAHRPTHEDEASAVQSWFIRLRPAKRRLYSGRWVTYNKRRGRRRSQREMTAEDVFGPIDPFDGRRLILPELPVMDNKHIHKAFGREKECGRTDWHGSDGTDFGRHDTTLWGARS